MFPMYFSIVLSIFSYLHRLYHCKSDLLKEAFDCNRDLHAHNVITWYSSVTFLLKTLGLKEETFKENSLYKIKKEVNENLRSLYIKSWFKEKDDADGKLDTYFSFKNTFQKEKYLDIINFGE